MLENMRKSLEVCSSSGSLRCNPVIVFSGYFVKIASSWLYFSRLSFAAVLSDLNHGLRIVDVACSADCISL